MFHLTHACVRVGAFINKLRVNYKNGKGHIILLSILNISEHNSAKKYLLKGI